MSQGTVAEWCPVTIALTTYNRAGFLRRNLDRVLDELGPEDELLVLDNNSSDDTAEFIQGIDHPKLRYVFVERQGLNVSRNAALDEARHDDIAYLDDDAYPAPGWLAAFRYARLTRPTAAIYAGRTEIEFESEAPAYLPTKFRYLLGAIDYGEQLRRLRRWESPGGGNMLVNRKRLLSICRFDERFDRKGTGLLSNGETEIATALHDHGVELIYVPNAVIHHWAGRDRTRGSWLFRRAYFQGVSDGLVAAKQGRLLWSCLGRIAFHGSKGPLEAMRSVRRPRALLFGAILEAAKTAGTLGARWHAD